MKHFFFLAMVGVLLTGCGGQAAEKNPVVVMETSMGTIKIELYPDKTPVTVKNFLSYVDDKFYDGTIFHRVIASFMIQGGGFETGLKEKPKTKDPIQNESAKGLPNERGTIAMARTMDLNSATCQFYINVVDNKKLDPLKYCAFGKVIDGMDVVDKIKDVKTVNKVGTVKSGEKTQMQDVPEEDVIIKSVRRAEK